MPWGLTKMLHWLKNTYGDIPIVITENGVSDRGGIDDKIRVDYHRVSKNVQMNFFVI